MGDDLFPVLLRFHREVTLPDMRRMFEEQEQSLKVRFDEMSGRFDAVFQRLDRLESHPFRPFRS